MKRYTNADTNVPMAFYYFYVYVRFPFTVISFIYGLFTTGIQNEFIFLINLLDLLTFACACVGLIKKKYWGIVINRVILIAGIVIGIINIIVGLYLVTSTGDYESFSTQGAGFIILNPLFLIYFEKRKYLFDGAPMPPGMNIASSEVLSNSIKTQSTQVEETDCQSPFVPEGYAIDNDRLPYKKNRVYGWGKEFNVFITSTGQYFHRSKCPRIRGKKKILFHRYSAMLRYLPCNYCKPKASIDTWYAESFPNSPYVLQNISNNKYTGEQLIIKED